MFKLVYRYPESYEDECSEFDTYAEAEEAAQNLLAQTDGYVEGEIYEQKLCAEFYMEMKPKFKKQK